MSREESPGLVADFETTTDPNDCRVWAYAVADIALDPHVTYGTELGEFLEFCSRQSETIYFHNLAFDGAFILDAIMKQGYVWVKDRPRAGEFSTLISSMGKFYQVVIHWKSGETTRLRDSLKKIPMSVSAAAKAFELEEGKGDLDYTKPRPKGYRPSKDEWDYIRRDVKIIAQALYKQHVQGMRKLTVGADALAEYKGLTGKVFNTYFPVLNTEMDSVIRTAYRGGFTYADTRHQGKRVGAGQTFDVNSLYPYIMRERPIPYGVPKWFDGMPPDDGSQFIVSVTFTAQVKQNHIPMIQAKKSMFYSATEYLRTIDEPITLAVTDVDLKLMQDHYDLDIICFNGGLTFNSFTGLFNDYIDKWSAVKERSEGGTKLIAKLFLNSLYGKFATNPDVTGKYPVLEDDIVKLRKGDDETRDPVYTAAGVFITSWARDLTIRAAQANYATFAYADTDSLHLLTQGAPIGLTVDPAKLGAWKREYGFSSAIFLRAKQYGELVADGKHAGQHEIHIAGAPKNIVQRLTLDDLHTGNVFHGKLVPRRVPGGIVLEETTFTIT